MAIKLGCSKIKRLALDFIADNFHIFQKPIMYNQLNMLDKEVLIEIIKTKAKKDNSD